MQEKTKNHLRLSILLVTSLWLTGCAIMDKEECLNANWHNLGRWDALNGEYQLSSRTEACAEHGLKANKEAYVQGVQEGLRGFCTAASGQAHGEKGGNYSRGFCPSNTEAAFLTGYTPAYKKYQFRKKMRDLQLEVNNKKELLNQELSKEKKDISRIKVLRNEIQQLKSEMQTEMYIKALE